MGKPRYVILHHDHPSPHYDLMLEQGGTLRTWRLPAVPAAGQTLRAEASFPHRLAYLDYEGPVSGNRGQVVRWDRGTFTGDPGTEPVVTVRCQGVRLHGTLRLERKHDEQWELTFTMDTQWQQIDPEHPDASLLAEAGRILRRGGLVAFPTETVYGLGANALDAAAVQGIFTAKGRPANNPVIVHVAAVEQVAQVAATLPAAVPLLASRFWPGPLTLVLPRADTVPAAVTAGGPTVAVRVPRHPVALGLLRAAGVPVAAPSANRSQQLSPTRAEHVWHDLHGRIDLLLDGGPTPGGIESTVLDVTTHPPRLLRPGLVSLTELEALLGPVLRPTAVNTTQTLPSPGMLPKHYAPRTPLELVTAEGREGRMEELRQQGCKVGWVTISSPPFQGATRSSPPLQGATRSSPPFQGGAGGVKQPPLTPPSEGGEQQAPPLTPPSQGGEILVVMPAVPAAYAARLYAVLHDLDRLGLDRLLVERPPPTEDWLAVRDRLERGGHTDGGPMKQITITIRPFRAEAVLHAVNDLDVIACTVQEVKGYGRQKGYLEKYLGGEFSLAFLPKVEINLWVTDDQAEAAIAHLQHAARTGRMGDGKIFLVDTAWPEPLEF